MRKQTLKRHAVIRPYKQGDEFILVLSEPLDGFAAGTLVGRADTLDGIRALRREYAIGMEPMPTSV